MALAEPHTPHHTALTILGGRNNRHLGSCEALTEDVVSESRASMLLWRPGYHKMSFPYHHHTSHHDHNSNQWLCNCQSRAYHQWRLSLHTIDSSAGECRTSRRICSASLRSSNKRTSKHGKMSPPSHDHTSASCRTRNTWQITTLCSKALWC